jgi:hypothetical protein
LVCLPLTAKSVLISCSLSFISLLKFLDFPFGINIAVEAIAYIRGVRLDLNRNLTDAKLEIKENAIKLFMEHLDTLLEADKDASDTFKNGFIGREIAHDTMFFSFYYIVGSFFKHYFYIFFTH